MDLIKRVIKKSVLVLIPLTGISFLADWKSGSLKFAGLFGNPDYMTSSIIIGGVLGLVNLKGLVWGLERLLGTYKADAKLIFLSLFRLFILFAVIIILVAMKLINLLGFLIGMTAVFIILIAETLKTANKEV